MVEFACRHKSPITLLSPRTNRAGCQRAKELTDGVNALTVRGMTDPILEHLRAAIVLLRKKPNLVASAVAAELSLELAGPDADFGKLLKERRLKAGFKVGELAKRARICVNTVKNLESGSTNPARDSMALLLSVPELKLSVAEHVEAPESSQELQPNCYLTLRYDPAGLAQDLRAIVNGPGGTIEQTHLYLDSQSAADYLAVCQAYGGLRGRLMATLDDVAERVAKEFPQLDIIAVGSGDGQAEVGLAQALAHHGRVGTLYLLDISHVLLAKAYAHAAAALHPLGVEVKAVSGNFHELQRYSMLHGGRGKPPRLYTLLGATIANLADELRFFRDLASCAASGDLAVLDYQLAHDPPEKDPTLLAGTVPKIIYDWHAGPLVRNNPNVRDVKIDLQLGPGRIPGSYVVICAGTATLADGTTRLYRIGGSSRYQSATLTAALAGAGWETVFAKAYDQRTAVLLLRRT